MEKETALAEAQRKIRELRRSIWSFCVECESDDCEKCALGGYYCTGDGKIAKVDQCLK